MEVEFESLSLLEMCRALRLRREKLKQELKCLWKQLQHVLPWH